MKKLATLGVMLLATMTLAACGSSKANKTASSSSDPDTHTVRPQKKADRYFKNNFLKINDLTVKITKTAVIPKGNKGNQYNEGDVFTIWYDITNTSGKKDISPLTAVMLFEATQETKNTDKKLDVGSSEDKKLTDIQDDNIKKGKTSKGSISWILNDNKTPIKLSATLPSESVTVGTQTYNIKQ